MISFDFEIQYFASSWLVNWSDSQSDADTRLDCALHIGGHLQFNLQFSLLFFHPRRRVSHIFDLPMLIWHHRNFRTVDLDIPQAEQNKTNDKGEQFFPLTHSHSSMIGIWYLLRCRWFSENFASDIDWVFESHDENEDQNDETEEQINSQKQNIERIPFLSNLSFVWVITCYYDLARCTQKIIRNLS